MWAFWRLPVASGEKDERKLMEDTGVGGLDRPSKGIVLEAIEGLGSKAEGQYSTAKESCPS